MSVAPESIRSCKESTDSFDVIPSLDLLDGGVVRLRRGAFDEVTRYGDPRSVLDRLDIPPGTRLHVVDLEGARSGRPVEIETVKTLRRYGYRLQVGGGIRSTSDARRWVDAGADKVVIGTLAATSSDEMTRIVSALGSDRIIPAVDLRDGLIRITGWTSSSDRPVENVLSNLQELGLGELLVTDIGRDGMLQGPSLDLYRRLSTMTNLRLLASGGVSTMGDVVSLARIGAGGAIIGRAMLDGHISYAQARARAALRDCLPERVIPCLDVHHGRVVKGVQFRDLRDAGDPVECAKRCEAEGADELVLLDVSATTDGRETSLETVRHVAGAIFIPLTIGGGVASVDDFRSLLRAGADRVAMNSAAIRNPRLIADCAREFGRQAVVLSCDAKRVDDSRWEAMVRGGRESSGVDAVSWCRDAESLGAGEILLTSVDRDGTGAGFDLQLLRAVSSSVSIGVIASGGAGQASHFREAIEIGGARAVLAASRFHDRILSVQQVKEALAAANIPVRMQSGSAP